MNSIAVHEDGTLLPDPQTGYGNLRLTLQFTTTSPKYSWVNKCMAWGIGTVDMKQGKVFVEVFIP